MRKKKKNSHNKHSEVPTKKHKDKNRDKKHPNPEESYEETVLPIKEMSVTGGRYHPHNEEILDGTPQ